MSQIVFDQLDQSLENLKTSTFKKKSTDLNALPVASGLASQCQSNISSLCYMHTHLVYLGLATNKHTPWPTSEFHLLLHTY